ncbi:MAG: hypothetical protein J6Z43_06580 [Clostridiales bacterium]|nr:hypothetical protein [Clostridiales bacterium]
MRKLECKGCGANLWWNGEDPLLTCAVCGSQYFIDDNNQIPQEIIQLNKTIKLASDHIRAGHFGEAVRLISPLVSQFPSDKRLYELLIRACTKDYTCCSIEDSYTRKIASDSWDSLARLGGITNQMRAYSMRKCSDTQDKNKGMITVGFFFLFLAALSSMIAGISWVTSHYLLALLFCGGVLGSLYYAFICLYGGIIKIRNEKEKRTLNPFEQQKEVN